MATPFNDHYRTDSCPAAHYDVVFTSPDGLAATPHPIQDHFPPPTGVLGEVPEYSDSFSEYSKEHQSKYESLTENQDGIFLEDHAADDLSRHLNQYPPHTNTWEMNYTTNFIAVHPLVGPSPASGSHQPPPPPPPAATSTPNSRPENLYNCTHCRTWFDRYSRARDCRNMDLGLTPHHCLGRCGTIGCPVAYGSEALLLEHIKPRSAQCPSCPRTLSRKNMARHQKNFCSGRNLPAGPSMTGADE